MKLTRMVCRGIALALLTGATITGAAIPAAAADPVYPVTPDQWCQLMVPTMKAIKAGDWKKFQELNGEVDFMTPKWIAATKGKNIFWNSEPQEIAIGNFSPSQLPKNYNKTLEYHVYTGSPKGKSKDLFSFNYKFKTVPKFHKNPKYKSKKKGETVRIGKQKGLFVNVTRSSCTTGKGAMACGAGGGPVTFTPKDCTSAGKFKLPTSAKKMKASDIGWWDWRGVSWDTDVTRTNK
jgi:hypothetical protein